MKDINVLFCIGKGSLYTQWFINSLAFFFYFDLFCHLYDAY